MFEAEDHNKLVEMGQACILARGGAGRTTKAHRMAIDELDELIWHLMFKHPQMFRPEMHEEMDIKMKARL